MVLGGALDVNAADKAARFVWLCDAFNIPLVFLHDVPGLHRRLRGREAGHHPPRRQDAVRGERGDGAEDQSVILRKSYGAGYFVMNGLAYEADYIVAWPTAEIAVMGPDGAVNIIHRKHARGDRGRGRARRRSGSSSPRRSARTSIPYIAAGHAQLDDVIDPADTRARDLAGACRSSRDKQVDRPWRKHGVLPV